MSSDGASAWKSDGDTVFTLLISAFYTQGDEDYFVFLSY